MFLVCIRSVCFKERLVSDWIVRLCFEFVFNILLSKLSMVLF